MCVANYELCNGVATCRDRSDESDDACQVKICSSDEFKCRRSGKCIQMRSVCNKKSDCKDGSDEEEEFCLTLPYVTTEKAITDISTEEFDVWTSPLPLLEQRKCSYSRIACISNCTTGALPCNNAKECEGGRDEELCPLEWMQCSDDFPFACSNKEICLPSRLVCNGKSDCTDFSDEDTDSCQLSGKDNEDHFTVDRCMFGDRKEFSCRSRCGQVAKTQCSCDAECHWYGDCCYDYETTCLMGITEHGKRRIDEIYSSLAKKKEQPSLKEFMACQGFSIKPTQGVVDFFLLVTKCPEAWENANIRRKCEKDGDDFDSEPVYQTPFYEESGDKQGITYRNMFCAVCHSRKLLELRQWFAEMKCDRTIRNKETIEQGNETNISDLIKSCKFHTHPPWNIQHRPHYCVLKYGYGHYNNITSTCLANDMLQQPTILNNLAWLSEMCDAYFAPVASLFTGYRAGQLYRNSHCAMCNGVVRTYCPTRSFSLGPSIELPSFSLLLDFSTSVDGISYQGRSVVTKDKKCKGGQVYDYDSDTCLTAFCNQGLQRQGDRCILPFNQSALASDFPGLTLTPSMGDALSISLVVGVSCDRIPELVELPNELITVLGVNSHQIIDVKLTNNGGKDDCTNTSVISFTVTVGVRFDRDTYRATVSLAYIWDTTSRAIRLNAFNPAIEVASASLQNYDFGAAYACPNGELVSYSAADVTFVENADGADYVIVNSTQTMYGVDNLLINATRYADGRTRVSLTGCESELLICLKVSLDDDQYEIDGNNRVTTKTGHVLLPSHYESVANSSSIIVCASQLKTTAAAPYSNVSVEESSFESYVKGVLSLVTGVLSLVCLALTFATYCRVPAMRTLPGKMVMCFVATLFLAQLLLLVGVHRTDARGACVVVAVALHYLWLCAFAWMHVMAFDIARTFALAKQTTKRRRTMWKYGAYAATLPLVFVAPCVVVHAVATAPRLYAVTSCWISHTWALLGAFVLPAALVFLSNVVLFAVTAHTLGRMAKVTMDVGSTLSPTRRLVFCAKMSTLLGFTWLSGFLAAIFDAAWLWYVFIVCNSLQGVSIFLAYVVFNKTIWNRRGGKSSSHNASGSCDITCSSRLGSHQRPTSIPSLSEDSINLSKLNVATTPNPASLNCRDVVLNVPSTTTFVEHIQICEK
ncbi:PREDICTED: uncharacterized protein LOC106815238 [Priapulus caudatus]|uniref:Uncharacterized protein LOC106815238 n=1 Tax=Priapulus caudatus TaxID=37621 RepID=A0ABM1ESI6_PRICU|nr:PREDICTED: uncharacterized protein LOC106815238 [Priapulus caudatus]